MKSLNPDFRSDTPIEQRLGHLKALRQPSLKELEELAFLIEHLKMKAAKEEKGEG